MSKLTSPLILVADDDPQFLRIMEHRLRGWSYRVECATSKARLLEQLATFPVDLLLLDVRFGEHDGVEVLRQIKSDYPDVRVTMLTAFGSIDNAVTAIKFGAIEYLTKPVDMNQLRAVLANTVDGKVAKPAVQSGSELSRPILGESPAARQLRALIDRVAATDATVLMLGESGTGKELVARAIHERSKRRSGPFVPLNMAALPKELVETILFGHAKGAFTGADQTKIGCCEAADQGTLFLDEVAEMEIGHQAKILRFLQERSFQRVGQSSPVSVDVRVVAATNRDPIEQIKKGHLREDLYYRLNVFPIVVPPLRERREDIALLARHFLARAFERYGRGSGDFSAEAIHELSRRNWPGNIRQLENFVERLAILSSTTLIDLDVFPDEATDLSPAHDLSPEDQDRPDGLSEIDRIERNAIARSLAAARGNVAEAAKSLGLAPATVYRKIKKYKIEIQR
jgi:DNA-binding NtrC family response regulator